MFIAFDKPHRLRVHGKASISKDKNLLKDFKEAELVVKIKLENYWQNCPRYIHKYVKIDESKYVPKKNVQTPLAGWKKTDLVQDVLPEKDKKRIKKKDIIGISEWIEKVKNGDPSA